MEQFADGHLVTVGRGQRDFQQAAGFLSFQRAVVGSEDLDTRDLPNAGATVEGHIGAHSRRDIKFGKQGIAKHGTRGRQRGEGNDFSRV